MDLPLGYNKVILSVYSFCNFSVALLTVTLTCINSLVQSIYSVDIFFVETCTSVFFINYVIFLIPAYYFEERFGIKKTLLLGCTIMLIGSVIRIGAFSSFWWIFAGSIISSLSQPFLLNPITRISMLWFEENQRVISTSISMIFFLIGQASSYSISTQIVSPNASKQDVSYLMILEAGICALSFLSVLLLFKDTSTSSISLNHQQNSEKSIKDELKDLFKNWNFTLLFISSFISAGTGNYFAVIMEIMATKHGFSSKDMSYFGVISIFTGIISCLIFSIITSNTHKFKLTCVITSGGTALGYMVLYFGFVNRNFIVAAFASMFYGFFLMPCYTVPLEYACEITFPIRENLSSGLINCFGQVFALVPVMIAYIFNNEPHKCMILAFGLQVLAFILMLGTKEELKRRNAELFQKIVDSDSLGIN